MSLPTCLTERGVSIVCEVEASPKRTKSFMRKLSMQYRMFQWTIAFKTNPNVFTYLWFSITRLDLPFHKLCRVKVLDACAAANNWLAIWMCWATPGYY